MQEVLQRIAQLLQVLSDDKYSSVNQRLESIANSINEAARPSFEVTYLPSILGIIGSLVAVFFGYYISKAIETRKNIRQVHFEFLVEINGFHLELHKLYTDWVSYNKLLVECRIIDAELFDFSEDVDYYKNALEVSTLEKKLDNPVLLTTDMDRFMRFEKNLRQKIASILDFDLFIRTGSVLNSKAMPLSLLIQKDLNVEFNRLVSILADATGKNMVGFDFEKYRKQIIALIETTKKVVVKKT